MIVEDFSAIGWNAYSVWKLAGVLNLLSSSVISISRLKISSNFSQRIVSETYKVGCDEQKNKFEECEANFKVDSDLNNHTKSKPEGIVYSCQHCRYKSTRKNSVKRHNQYKHEGEKYSCNQCEYQTSWQGDLKKHKESMHGGVQYLCNQCEYQATHQRNLIKIGSVDLPS